MSEHHRKCYKLLKYILNGIIARTATVFHSYALKTLVLNHHYHEKCEETCNMAKCAMELILKIQSIMENSPVFLLRYDMRQHLPNMFFKSMSVWNHEQSIVDSDIRIRLQRLMKRLEKISSMKEYSFDKCYIRSVNCSNLNRVYVPIGFILYEALDHIFEKQWFMLWCVNKGSFMKEEVKASISMHNNNQLSHLMRLWYLSHRRPAKAQASLRIRAVSPEPSLFADMKYACRRRVRPQIGHQAPLNEWACAFEEWV